MPLEQYDPTYTPPPTPYPIPYPQPPYQPPPQSLQERQPGYIVDKLMPQVPFYYRPLALKIAIGLIITGVIFCLGFLILIIPAALYSYFSILLFGLFLIIGILGIISIILLMLPKRIGWYIALVAAILGLIGLGPGTIISIFVLIALNWPSTLYFFRTGRPPPEYVYPYPYPYPYPYFYPPRPYPYPSSPAYNPSPLAEHQGESMKVFKRG